MACFFGHAWKGLKCEKCGKTRDIEKLIKSNDQKALSDVAFYDRDANIRGLAIRNLSDQKGLIRVAMSGIEQNVLLCTEATKKITDQEALTYLAQHHKYSETRIAAAKNLTDKNLAEKVFAEIALNDVIHYTGKEAVNELTNQKLLTDIANNARHSEVREAARKKLG